MKKRFGRGIQTLAVLLAMLFVMNGCSGDKLNETSFSEPLENQGMAVGDSIGTQLNISNISLWKVSYDGDGSEVQYIECGDETAAKNFYNTQISAFKDITGKGTSGNSYKATSDGYFYYACLVENKVVLATGKTSNWETIRAILDKMPQVP